MSMPIPISSYEDWLDYTKANTHKRTMDDKHYPRIQYSVFPNGSRDEQVVIRADSFEEFTKLKKEVDPLLNAKPSRNTNAQRQGNGEMQCMKCRGEAEYREGVSKKTDKPYKGIFCLNDDCDFAKFL